MLRADTLYQSLRWLALGLLAWVLYTIASGMAWGVNFIPVTLAWDDPNPPGEVAEYRLYLGSTSGKYGTGIPCGVTSKTVSLPLRTIRYACVSAINFEGTEGLPSDELVFRVEKATSGGKTPKQPGNLRIAPGG